MGYPSPSELPHEPEFTAAGLVAEIRARSGRVMRFREVCVICLTTNPDTATWLRDLGGKSFVPVGLERSMRGPHGGYLRDTKTGLTEWDIYIHAIPVKGEQTIWEAAAPPVEEPVS
jgi:hypothetical protein